MQLIRRQAENLFTLVILTVRGSLSRASGAWYRYLNLVLLRAATIRLWHQRVHHNKVWFLRDGSLNELAAVLSDDDSEPIHPS